MAYKFQYGFVIMAHEGITYVVPASRNGRPIYAPASLQYQSKFATLMIPGMIGYKSTKQYNTEWVHDTLSLYEVLTHKVLLVTDYGDTSISRYYEHKIDVNSKVLDITNRFSSWEGLHALAIHIGNGR